MNLIYASLSHIGMQRERNEDRCYPDPTRPDPLLTPELVQQKGQLFIIADGMGGMAAGEVASQMAVETIVKEFYGGSDRIGPGENLVLAVKSANFRIYDYASGSELLSGMGTTTTALVVKEGEAYIAHVGDSRAYLYRDGQLRQLTEDHSWVAEQVKARILTEEQARVHPSRHLLARALGTQPHVHVDTITLLLRPGDLLLLCTDGLTRHLTDHQIAKVISTNTSPKAICETLITEANQKGGEDNVTVIVIQCEPMTTRRKAGTTDVIRQGRSFRQWLRKIPYMILAILLAGAILGGAYAVYIVYLK